MVVNLQSGHEYLVEITLKIDKPELWFMCSARRLIVLYIYVKFLGRY